MNQASYKLTQKILKCKQCSPQIPHLLHNCKKLQRYRYIIVISKIKSDTFGPSMYSSEQINTPDIQTFGYNNYNSSTEFRYMNNNYSILLHTCVLQELINYNLQYLT